MSVVQRWTLGVVAALVVLVAGGVAWSETRGDDRVVSADPVSADSAEGQATTTTVPSTTVAPTTTTTAPPVDALPPGSGSGHRAVFSVGAQRMWWVDETETVVRTSLVSGRAATPGPGTYQVYSRTEHATGLDGSKMDKFVRFTKGPNGWAIGFHGIPTMDGVPVQTEEQLGQPLSHGCIRQKADDADFTWNFLPVGATVVVVA